MILTRFSALLSDEKPELQNSVPGTLAMFDEHLLLCALYMYINI